MGDVVKGYPLVEGVATGEALVSQKPISFWGGVDPQTGEIIDQRHDRCGTSIAGRICFFPAEKGSSTASAVLLELARTHKAPAAIVVVETPPILMLGAMIAQRLYNVSIPVLRVAEHDYGVFTHGQSLRISSDGAIRWEAEKGRDPLPGSPRSDRVT